MRKDHRMFHLTGKLAADVTAAISDGTATKVAGASSSFIFEDDRTDVDFWEACGRVVRVECSEGDHGEKRLDAVTGDDLSWFKAVYHLD